jgi:hypothetical protein
MGINRALYILICACWICIPNHSKAWFGGPGGWGSGWGDMSADECYWLSKAPCTTTQDALGKLYTAAATAYNAEDWGNAKVIFSQYRDQCLACKCLSCDQIHKIEEYIKDADANLTPEDNPPPPSSPATPQYRERIVVGSAGGVNQVPLSPPPASASAGGWGDDWGDYNMNMSGRGHGYGRGYGYGYGYPYYGYGPYGWGGPYGSGSGYGWGGGYPRAWGAPYGGEGGGYGSSPPAGSGVPAGPSY